MRAPGRDDSKTRFLRDHRAAGVTAQLGLLALLLGVCVYMPGLAVPLVLGGGVCWAAHATGSEQVVVSLVGPHAAPAPTGCWMMVR